MTLKIKDQIRRAFLSCEAAMRRRSMLLATVACFVGCRLPPLWQKYKSVSFESVLFVKQA
jgi:hypothetical protein